MSGWDQHVQAMQAMGAEMAAICGLDGNVWVATPGFNPTPTEVRIVIKAAKGEELTENEHLEINGLKFMQVGMLDGDVSGCKLISKNVGQESSLCVVGLSNQAVVLGLKSGPSQRIVVDACEREVKYLKESGL